ncbi:BREX-1 system adenine-specific DNA-methyltransferase PglX [Sphingobium mellinum]|uniref:BREX-1 system adenine-specific DNA-methyltransferase PglX n=1 Tax=Sphingobium mellinum TaxID=1387166 RepID=UPI0030ECFD6A
MDTNALKKFAQSARNLLIDQVTARLDMVLAEGAAARREHPEAIGRLEAAAKSNRQQVIEQAAYTWFNRFTALRFMDATGLTNPRVVSPADGATRPEILAEAMAGNLPDRARAEIAEYLNGTRPAHDGQAEAYRLLLIHACNEWHGQMPYMFERADMLDRAEDYTELLMPDDLLAPDSILARLRGVMTEDACQDVEIIGWLYQFYISEKKDQVFAGLKKNIKITAENIPAATQLFTPHWIVRYLVENSLGRLWLLNRPQSKLAAQMDYYIAPEEPETDFLRIERPEDIRICDPACGSGHMLTYAFDLLYAIYEEEGYEAATIPALILTHNLTGIEIDDRAGALAAFALSMKVAAKLGRRRFLRTDAKPDIVVLQDVRLTSAEMHDVAVVVGKDLLTDELRETLGQFEQAKNFGSLIVPKLRDPAETLRVVEARDFGGDLLLKEVQARVVAVLRMAEALSPKYHVVVANPPYAGSKGLNPELQDLLKGKYADCKADLFAAFIQRGLSLVSPRAFSAMVTMESWMFLSSYEKLRLSILENRTISNMLHMPYLGKGGTSMGISFGTTAFVAEKRKSPDEKGNFQCVRYYETDDLGVPLSFPTLNERSGKASSADFTSIPGGPLAYWANGKTRQAFAAGQSFKEFANPRVGMQTANNDYFLRSWWEVSLNDCSFFSKSKKWIPYSKGGEYRRWWGNNEHILFFDADGGRLKAQKNATLPDLSTYERERCTWSDLGGNSKFGVRKAPSCSFYDIKGHSFFPSVDGSLSYSNSNVFSYFLSFVCSGMNFQVGDVGKAPAPEGDAVYSASKHEGRLVNLSKSDWDAYEASWDFTTLPLLSPDNRTDTLAATYANLRAHWQGVTDEMQRLEEENNRTFIKAYGLQEELAPEVPVEEITLTCNPAYSLKAAKTDEEREAALRGRTIEEFLHYAVGCMFGRYSLDAPGLILANQGEGNEDYLARVPEPTFAPDRDNVIPVLDADWFADDIVTRIREFLRVTFGEAKFRENLTFIEKALGKDLRKWFTKDFFDYHVRRYKKRPIYWMFSSPKGSFNALIYMHRYRPDSVSVVLNQYLREFIHKLEVERARLEKLAADPTATQGQSTKAQKDIGAVIKQIAELTEWEREVVYPMAQQKIAIDLDDGVKRNYLLFAGALKPIKGLDAADD